jgi:hypothetical protein
MPKKPNDLTALKHLFLVCPETGSSQRIVRVEAVGTTWVITTLGKETAWTHRVRTSEADPYKVRRLMRKATPAKEGE